MFLDPDPKRQKSSGSGFFSSQRPVESPRDRSATWRRKHSPLGERSQAEDSEQNPATIPITPTVRLVKQSPDPFTSDGSEDGSDIADSQEDRRYVGHSEQLGSSPTDIIEASVLKPGSSGSVGSDQGFHVSGPPSPTNDVQASAQFRNDNLLSSISGYAVPRIQWHRRSGSSGFNSHASTLRESESAYEHKSFRTESRTSEGTTLRGTPTPTELEHRERIEADESWRQPSIHRLEPLQETSPERTTVRLIRTPPQSSSSGNPSPSEEENITVIRPRTSPSDSDREAALSRESSRRTSSVGSLPVSHHVQSVVASPTLRSQRSEGSFAQSETVLETVSSPNVVAYYSDSSRPQSRSQRLHAAIPDESDPSRYQYVTINRPGTRRSVATAGSWDSRPPSADTPPPLHIPKKRLRHQPASSALNQAAAPSERAMEDADVDTLPYPRQAFSMHLSTIASESVPASRAASQQLSRFSVGSGVWTVDDSISNPRSDIWAHGRESGDDYVVSPVSPIAPSISNDELEEMSLRGSQEQRALPQPLFYMRSPSAPIEQKRYEGPLPPLPPIPKSPESDEDFDTVPELARPSLHKQRSGYSLRRRSHSTPSGSHSRHLSLASESSRWSHGTSIFPTWAKAYYVYGATLLSSSQISLSTPIEAYMIQNPNPYKFNREWNSRSISSSWGTSDADSVSPASSRFLPAIFRSRGKRDKSATPKRKKNKGNKSSPREPNSRPDSMVISRDPLPAGQQNASSPVPTGYGSLGDEPEQQHQPLPRTYSKHKRWDQMEFPRPMSKDHLRGTISDPHLVPSKRTGNRKAVWPAPSFVESLDTLIHSSCNRQILLFALGFLCPLFWMLASVLPLPKRPMTASDFEKAMAEGRSEEDIQTAMMRHEAGDAEKRWREEKQWAKARWWRYLNRIMSVIGVLVIGAVIALAIVATSK